jgi:hypothetical protein
VLTCLIQIAQREKKKSDLNADKRIQTRKEERRFRSSRSPPFMFARSLVLAIVVLGLLRGKALQQLPLTAASLAAVEISRFSRPGLHNAGLF